MCCEPATITGPRTDDYPQDWIINPCQHRVVKPLSSDLRKRVAAAVVKGESSRAVASRFGVAVSWVVKWSQRYRRPAR